MSDHSVVVVGAGLAGLETARLLAADGAEVTVFEAAAEVGGRVRTDKRDGFTFDRGFQVLFTAYPEAQRALDLTALSLKRFPAGAIVCRPNHRSVVADPLRDPAHAIETAFSREFTLRDKLEVLRLRWALRGRSRDEIYSGSDETIENYLRRRGFSDRFIESFAAPFYGGITLDRSLETSRRVFQYTFRMLSAGAAAVPKAGMQAIPRQLARKAKANGASIETETKVASIAKSDGVALDLGTETVTADAVVVAAGPAETRRLTELDSIPVEGRSVQTQYFRIPAGNPLAKQGRIHLNAAESVPNQVVSLSAVAPSYATGTDGLVAASTNGELEDDPSSVADRTRKAIASWYPAASFDDLELLETVTIPVAQYDQPPGIHETLPAVDSPEGAVYVAGDITSDSSINGALRSGRQAAETIVREELSH